MLLEQQRKKPREEAPSVARTPVTPEGRQEPDVTPTVPAPSTTGWQFSIGPRVAYRTLAPILIRNNTQGELITGNQGFIVGGVTLTLTPPDWPASELLLTALYGGGRHSEVQLLSTAPPLALRGKTNNSELLDIELLYRHSLPDTNAQLFASVQYIHQSADLGITIPGLGPKIPLSNDIFLAKAGLGGFYPLSVDNAHRIFSNFLLGAGFIRFKSAALGEDDSAALLAWDVNLGYQWIINPRNALRDCLETKSL